MNIHTTIIEFLNEQKDKLNDNFWKWFGDSKIEENGKPMICYHGSNDPNIKVFDLSKVGYNTGNYGHYGYGVYFSTHIKEAKVYGKYIYKCYIKIEKPFIGSSEQILELKDKGLRNIDDLVIKSIDFESFKNSFKKGSFIYNFLSDMENIGRKKAWKRAFKNNKDSDLDILNDIQDILEYTTLSENPREVPEHVLDDLNKLNISPKFNRGFPYEQSLHWITDLGNNSKEVTDMIIELGYDGVFYGSEIIAFKPNQIKSIQNDGSWNISDDNIYS